MALVFPLFMLLVLVLVAVSLTRLGPAAGTRLLALSSLIVTGGGVALLVLLKQQQGDDPATLLALPLAWLLAATALTLVVALMVRQPVLQAGLLSGAAVTLLVIGILGIFSIGAPLLFAALLAGGAALRGIALAPIRTVALAVGAGGAVALAAAAAVFAPTMAPSVECHAGGGVTVNSGWGLFGDAGGGQGYATSGGGSLSRGGDATGVFTSGPDTYTYRCRAGRLVEFTKNGQPVS